MDIHTTHPLALVTGATGTIGPALVNYLLQRDYHVRILVHNWSTPVRFAGDVEIYRGDLTDEHSLNKITKDIHVIFHLAAKLHINNPDQYLWAEYKKVNVEGTRCLISAAKKANVHRFIFFSTINVYGISEKGFIFDEESPVRPDSLYAKTKFQAENIVLNSGLPSVVLRLAAVYGPKMKGNYLTLLNALRKRLFVIAGDGLNRRTLVHVQDVCQASVKAAESPIATGQIYNVTDGQIYTMQEIIATLCTVLGRKYPKITVSPNIVRTVLGLIEEVLRLSGYNPVIGRFLIDKFTEDIAICSERIQQELGFRPKYDLVTGWQEFLKANL